MARSLLIKVPTVLLSCAAFALLDAPWGLAVGGAIFALGVGLISWIAVHPNASLWADTRWRAPSESDAVALTFDDGPDPKGTLAIAKVLADHDVSAAFFVIGERAAAHPEVLAQLREAGHLVCNHSHTHAMTFHFSLWSTFRRELAACNEAIVRAIGEEPALFRAPQGIKNPALCDVLGELDMTAVGWQVRGLDAVGGDADAIARRVLEGARPGGVILLHDGTGYGRSEATPTIEALPRIIEGLRARGLRFARLDELLEVEPYVRAEPVAS